MENDGLIIEHAIQFSKWWQPYYYSAILRICKTGSLFSFTAVSPPNKTNKETTYYSKTGIDSFLFIERKSLREYEVVFLTSKEKVYMKLDSDESEAAFRKKLNAHLGIKKSIAPREKIGNSFSSHSLSKSNTSFIVNDVYSWTTDEVLGWLSNLRGDKSGKWVSLTECTLLTNQEKTVEQVIVEQAIRGETLQDLTVEQLMNNGVRLGDAHDIISEIKVLKVHSGFDPKWITILNKMEKATKARGSSVSSKEFRAMYTTYKHMRVPLSNPKVFMERFFKVNKLPDNLVRDFTMKLVIVAMGYDSRNAIAGWGIPFISPKYGIFHTALIIGPWYLEWNNSALCIPRASSSTKCVFCVDVPFKDEILNSHNPQDVEKKREILANLFEKLAIFIVSANNNATYEAKGEFFSSNGGNCQDFVGKLLEVVNAKLDFEKQVDVALKGMAKNVGKIFEFKAENKELIALYPSIRLKIENFRDQRLDTVHEQYCLDVHGLDAMFAKDNIIRFRSHCQLDLFCRYLLEELCTKHSLEKKKVREMYSAEHRLLKSFDRAYWLRYFAANSIVDNWAASNTRISDRINAVQQQIDELTESQESTRQQLESEKQDLERQQLCILERSRWAPFGKASSECPFGDPRETNSVPISDSFTKNEERKEKLYEMYVILEDYYEPDAVTLRRLIEFLNTTEGDHKKKLEEVFNQYHYTGGVFTAEPNMTDLRAALRNFLEKL